MCITEELALRPYLPLIRPDQTFGQASQDIKDGVLKMDTVSTIKSVLAAIAAQGSVTVTIPNDTELARDLGPVEITRQLGPVELRIQTAPAKKSKQAAPAKTPGQVSPPKVAQQSAPAEAKDQAAPAEVTSETAPASDTDQEAAAEPTRQVTPAKPANQVPVDELDNENQAQATGYAGLWYDHTGRSAIKIANCGEGLCGRIAWLKNSAHKSVCGTNIIGDVEKVGNVYDNGWIYDIERGKKFDVELKLMNENQLRVKGYAGTKLLSKTMVWRRAPSNLELCI